MKIGILTLHSQINYGGVLQTWAMQRYLQKQGHEVVVLDRRDYGFEDDICLVRDGGIIRWVKFLLRMFFCLGYLPRLLRAIKTFRFIRTQLNLSDYTFSSWKDAPKNIGVDRISVGSDQVWNKFNCREGFYLLEGAPNIPASSYAASFGMKSIPAEMKKRYKEGLLRFEHISVREKEGVEICKEFGITATHDCDPTMLLSQDDWKELIGDTPSSNKLLCVCYFIGMNPVEVWNELVQVAERYKVEVEVFANSFSLPFPFVGSIRKTLINFEVWFKWHFRKRSKYLHVKASADPIEFVRAFRLASFVVSDSFHALMFSSIFNKKARMIRPKSQERLGMFSRISEFIASGKNNQAEISESITEAFSSIDEIKR